MQRLIDGKKYKIVLGTRVKSGDLICYDGPSLIGYGIADNEDLDYIHDNLYYCKVIGNVFNVKKHKSILSDLSDGAVEFLIAREGIAKEDGDSVKKDIEDEIKEFLENC